MEVLAVEVALQKRLVLWLAVLQLKPLVLVTRATETVEETLLVEAHTLVLAVVVRERKVKILLGEPLRVAAVTVQLCFQPGLAQLTL
jgi:hypothetical protein